LAGLSEKIMDKNNKNGKPGETKKPLNGAFLQKNLQHP